MLRRFRKDIDGLKVKIVRWFCSTNLTIKQFQGLPVIYKVQKQALNFYRILMGRSDFIVLIIFFQ